MESSCSSPIAKQPFALRQVSESQFTPGPLAFDEVEPELDIVHPVPMLVAVCLVQAIAIAAAWLLRSHEQALRSRLPYLLHLAVGVLLATALLHLLPESVEALGNRRGLWIVLGATLFVLFTAERMVDALSPLGAMGDPTRGSEHDHSGVHGHIRASSAHSRLRPVSLIVGSSLHSFVDGAAIATAYAAAPRLGLLTAFAVALHEVPHRLGDLAVLLHYRVSSRRAMQLVAAVGVPALIGAGAVLVIGVANASLFRWLLPVSAGSFLYIAGVNLLPELRVPASLPQIGLQLLALAAGVSLVLLVTGLHAG